MLPLLPALIMLIVRGPSAVEAANVNAHRWGLREAVSQHLEPQSNPAVSSRAIQSLLELGKNPAFTRAIAELISMMPADAEPAKPPVAVEPLASPRLTGQTAFFSLPDGFTECRRSRDGPLSA